jgi:O-antigen ligase
MRGEKRYYGKADTLVQIAVYVFLINALCKYFLPNSLTKILPIFAVLLAGVRTASPFVLPIKKIDKPILVFLFVWFFGCLYSPAMSKGMGYVFSFAIAFIFGIYISQKNVDENKVMKFLALGCTILAAFILIQPVSPELVSRVNHLFSYSANEYALMNAWTRNGWYTGLFPDRAPAAFFCSVLIGVGLYYLYCNYKTAGNKFQRFFGVIFVFVGAYGVLLTVKRGLLIGAGIAAFVTFIVYKKANKAPIWRICLAAIVVVFVIWIVFSNMEVTQVMVARFVDNDNPLTYRDVIYGNIFEKFWSSPLIGTGTASAFSLLGIGGHNIYLTVLMENGILGFVVFISVLGYAFFSTVQLVLRFGSYEYHQGIPFLLFSLYIQVFFLVYGMSGNPLYDNYILYFYLFAIFIVKNSEYHFEKINLQGKAK